MNTFDYTIPAGDQNAKQITVSCTVTGKNDTSITDTDAITFWQVKLRIQSGGNDVPTIIPVMVGECVKLHAVIAPANTPVAEYVWTLPEIYETVPGMIVAGNNFNPASSWSASSFVGITDAHRKGTDVRFYFLYKRDDNKSLIYPYQAYATVRAKIENTTVSTTCTFKVTVPDTHFYNEEWGPIGLHRNYAWPTFPWGLFKGSDGIVMPCGILFAHRFRSTSAGYLCIVPIAVSYYSESHIPHVRIAQDSAAIDADKLPVARLSACFTDSPGNEIDTNYYLYTMRNDLFSTYVFYKPGTSESIWVPIAQVAWQWRAEAYPDSNSVWRYNVLHHPEPKYYMGIATLPFWTHRLIP